MKDMETMLILHRIKEDGKTWNSEFSKRFRGSYIPFKDDGQEYKDFICRKLGIESLSKDIIAALLACNRKDYSVCFNWDPAFCLVEDAMKYNFSLQRKRWDRGESSFFELDGVFRMSKRILSEIFPNGGDDIWLNIYLRCKRIELAILKIRHEFTLEEDEQRRRIREEQKALKELKKEKEQAEKDAAKAKAAIEKNEEALSKAKSSAQIQKLQEQIEALKESLRMAEERKERAISMAQQTRCGYVYIISNVGSFGEGVYKIGLTRRVFPMDRVTELSNASVPFPFDVHAFIYSEDAPGLEAALHRRFEERKVNCVNHRKEYFRVSLDEIRTEVESLGFCCEWVEQPTASQWRMSQEGENSPYYEFNPFEDE